jgi:hypothetical protein
MDTKITSITVTEHAKSLEIEDAEYLDEYCGALSRLLAKDFPGVEIECDWADDLGTRTIAVETTGHYNDYAAMQLEREARELVEDRAHEAIASL